MYGKEGLNCVKMDEKDHTERMLTLGCGQQPYWPEESKQQVEPSGHAEALSGHVTVPSELQNCTSGCEKTWSRWTSTAFFPVNK